jgi:uncharacterized membrane protein
MEAAESREAKLEKTIGYLLISGVVLSLLVEMVGIVSFFNTYGHLKILQDKSMFLDGNNFFAFLYALFQGKHHLQRPILLMILGISILVLTPYIRVVLSVIYFGWKKNIPFLLITLFVFFVITLSLAIR